MSIALKAPGTRVEAVAGEIRTRIAARRLVPGVRIPSVRAFADAMGVSKSTVVEAYERLAAFADGLLEQLAHVDGHRWLLCHLQTYRLDGM